MKYIVLSDTHRYLENAKAVLNYYKDSIDGFFHLGDHLDDAFRLSREFPRLKMNTVLGNNDYNSKGSFEVITNLEGYRIFLTHGHRERVYYGLTTLEYTAEEKNANITLFGHTHVPYLSNLGGRFFLNPGSITQPRGTNEPTFGEIEIDKGILKMGLYFLKENNSIEKFKTI